MSTGAICSRIQDYEGDVVMALNRCCGGEQGDPPTIDGDWHGTCTPNDLMGTSSKLEYSSAGASVCSYSSPPRAASAEYRNEYHDWGTNGNELTPNQKQQLCSALNAARPPGNADSNSGNLNLASVSFYNPEAAYIGPVVTRFSLSKGEGVRANYENENDGVRCREALRERKQRVEEYMKLETYKQICDRYPGTIEAAVKPQSFCAGLDADIAAKRAEIERLDVPEACSKFNNPDLKNLMHSLLEFTTSNSEVLNRVGFNVCTSLPSIFYRRFVNPTGPTGVVRLTEEVCGNSEIIGPGGNVNQKMNIPAAVTKGANCQNTRRFLNSLDIVYRSAVMSAIGESDRMETDPSYNVVSVCSKFALDPGAMVQLNNLGRTNAPRSTFTPGIFAAEFESVKDGSYLQSKTASSQDSLLKNTAFLDQFIAESMTNQCRYLTTMENRKVLCSLESTDVEPRPLPFFSNNPYLQLFSIREKLGVEKGVDDFEDVVYMNPVGVTSTRDCETEDLGVCQ